MHPSLPAVLSATLLAAAATQTTPATAQTAQRTAAQTSAAQTPARAQTAAQARASRISHPKPAAKRPSNSPDLPITHVSLYKNGVGFFEHTAHLTGSPTLTLDLTSAQLNDVLQTLTAVDLGGGHVTSANFNSTTPLAQQLANLPFSLGDPNANPGVADNPDPTQQDLYTALRGAKVEVTGAGPTFTGRILSLEIRSAPTPENAPDTTSRLSSPAQRVLTLVSDTGATRSLTLTSTTTVRLLDPNLRTDLNTYLALLDRNRNQGLRHLTLTDHAPTTSTAPRELRVSFLSEVPVWKSTYRLLLTNDPTPPNVVCKPTVSGIPGDCYGKNSPATPPQTATLQGFSVIDNTTGEDWTNIHLSLIAGSPQSFLQPLATPIYTRRPEIPIAEDAQLTPQTHDSAIDALNAPPTKLPRDVQMLQENGAPSPQAAGVAGMSGGSAGGVLGGVGIGHGSGIGPGTGGNIGGGVLHAQMGRNTAALPYATLAQSTTTAATTTAATDTLFAYNLTDPISIPRNGSALVPILTATLPAESVTLWSPASPTPLRALSLTNTSNLTLDRGSFSVVEDGAFAGEGLLDTIRPGEHRLLSFAADQAVRVSVDYQHDTRRVTRLSVHDGVLRATNTEIAEVEYLVNDTASDPRTVIVEEPRRPGWQLDSSPAGASKSSDPAPTETTPTALRFRVHTQPHETVRLHIGQRHTLDDFFRLTDTNEPQLTLYLRNNSADPALFQQLAPVFAVQGRLTSLDFAISQKQLAISTLVDDQKRLRDNLAALKGTPDERALARRYTAELNAQEDTLATLRQDLANLQLQRPLIETDLATAIRSLERTP